ncbi:hypothetical protein [Archangium lipolyticum]|uniref:hypothetical protein n=1 Tax=Archangium lipolyticum TaxID=2970465 RepID=UPI00214A46AF|nr:hypothetical protein [Archangium lipolyticum]
MSENSQDIKCIVAQIGALSHSFVETTLREFKEGNAQRITYDADGLLIGIPEAAFSLRGLYGIRITKDGRSGVAYVGKTQNDGRLRHHLSRRNKDGTALKPSVKNKHVEIRKAIEEGYEVFLCLCPDADSGAASLLYLEAVLALAARDDFKQIFPEEKHWNLRIG